MIREITRNYYLKKKRKRKQRIVIIGEDDGFDEFGKVVRLLLVKDGENMIIDSVMRIEIKEMILKVSKKWN